MKTTWNMNLEFSPSSIGILGLALPMTSPRLRHAWYFSVVFAAFPGMPCLAQMPFSSSDKNLSFTLPAGWKAEEVTGLFHITASDGSKYTLAKDQVKGSGKEASNDGALRSRAEKLAGARLSGQRYAGVRPFAVQSGSGTIFRFRGNGSKSEDDLAEIWIASTASHTVVLSPDNSPQPEHFLELSNLFKSLSIAGVSAVGSPASTPARRNAAQSVQASQPITSAKLSSPSPVSATPSASTGETRGYSGKLLANDISFKLTLSGEKSASADWVASPDKTSHFNGEFTGSEGNYVVNLNQTTGSNPLNATKLTLTLRALGGMESGTFTTDASSARRSIAELNLTSIDTTPGTGKLNAAGGSRPNVQQRRGRMHNRGRMGRLGKIPRMGKLARMGKLRRLE